MKLIVRKLYYEEDIYEFPQRRIGPFGKIKKNEILKSNLVHKKGDYKDTNVAISEKACCVPMDEQMNETIYIGEDYAENLHKQMFGCFLKGYQYGDEYCVSINHCPFCGEKIEIEMVE